MFLDLSSGLQEIIWYNYDVFVRSVILLLMVIFSLSYLFYFKQQEKKTVEYRVVFTRVIMNAFSKGILWTMPLYLVFFLNPEATYNTLLTPFLNFYWVIVSVYLLGLVVDVFRYGVPTLLVKFGMDFDDPKARRVVKNWLGGK